MPTNIVKDAIFCYVTPCTLIFTNVSEIWPRSSSSLHPYFFFPRTAYSSTLDKASVRISKTSVVTNFSDVKLRKITTFIIGTEIIIINCKAVSLESAYGRKQTNKKTRRLGRKEK